MALIIRIDVDRPYGRQPFSRHLLSRLSSDLYFPRIGSLGFLAELETMLGWLNLEQARAHVFFRRCTLPSERVLELLDAGRHEIGLHLEDSRSWATFCAEKDLLERHIGRKVNAVSKHGSGSRKFGFHHYAPYEPEKYVEWARHASMRVFLGNLQDPTVGATIVGNGLAVFPSAFWLEPAWRDTRQFPVEWLMDHARQRDVVLLVHPENVHTDPQLVSSFRKIIGTLESKVYQ
jgi:hypothetical protein